MQFVGRGTGLGVFLAADEAVMVLPQATTRAGTASAAVVRMKALGSRPPAAIVGAEQLPGVSSFMIGQDRSRWRQRVPQYARVEYHGVYPGVDLAFHGSQGEARVRLHRGARR